VTNKHRKS